MRIEVWLNGGKGGGIDWLHSRDAAEALGDVSNCRVGMSSGYIGRDVLHDVLQDDLHDALAPHIVDG